MPAARQPRPLTTRSKRATFSSSNLPDPPVVIVTLGRVAARHLLGTTAPISSYRGRWTSWQGTPVLPTFHPAYLLRNPAAKAQSWADLKQLARRLGD
jgi:DNA polymerase